MEIASKFIRRSAVLNTFPSLWTGSRLLSMSSLQLQQHSDDTSGENRYLTVTRIYSDKNGESRFGSFRIRMKGSGDIGYLSKLTAVRGVMFRQTPGNYHYSWHNAPQRQFIVNLDADVEVEVCSGEKRVIRQGEVFFVEDTTGKGHFSRAVGGKTRHSVFISVDDDFVAKDF